MIEKYRSVAELRRQGVRAVEIAKQLGVSKQQIYVYLKKARLLGEIVPSFCAKKKSCVVCGSEFNIRRRKTCGDVCLHKLLIDRSIELGEAKWSKYGYVDLKCFGCGVDFKRTKYQNSISLHCHRSLKNKEKTIEEVSQLKRNFCCQRCYLKHEYQK